MKKLTAAILSIVLVAMGAMFIFAQTADQPEGKRGFGKKGFGKRGEHARVFRGLDLTEEQKTQIKQIRETSKQTIQPIREQMKANRQKLAELSANGNFDQAQIQAIAQQQGSLSAQMIVERERVKAQIFQILTPEQKAKAAELKAQRQQKMQERRENRNEKRRNGQNPSGTESL
jgi:periplasmic protein CpxP/Spy